MRKYAITDDYEKDYGRVDYKGKTVMDIGTDWGSTAEFFAHKGASKIICVDGNITFLKELEENVTRYKWPVIIEQRSIQAVSDLEYLLQKFEVDIVKCDCDGCERWFETLTRDYARRVPLYIFEIHSLSLYLMLARRASDWGYTWEPASFSLQKALKLKTQLAPNADLPFCTIVYMKREDS